MSSKRGLQHKTPRLSPLGDVMDQEKFGKTRATPRLKGRPVPPSQQKRAGQQGKQPAPRLPSMHDSDPDDDEEEEEQLRVADRFAAGTMAKKVMELVQEQQEELRNDNILTDKQAAFAGGFAVGAAGRTKQSDDAASSSSSSSTSAGRQERRTGAGAGAGGAPLSFNLLATPGSAVRGASAGADGDDDDDDERDDDVDTLGLFQRGDDDDDDEDHSVYDLQLTEEERRALDMFLPSSSSSSSGSAPALGEMGGAILQRMQEHEAQADTLAAEGYTGVYDPSNAVAASKLPKDVVSAYQRVGSFLANYTSGPLPKAFKVIPVLKDWEELLFHTNPPRWSPQATYNATVLLSTKLTPRLAQRFYTMVLLPKFSQDVAKNKTVGVHIYNSIRRAVYKPTAFFKGIVLALAEQGCSAREASIMASILARCSLPVIHSSVALLKLTQMPFSGARILFILTLIKKRYALPVQVLEALVGYFDKLSREPGTFPLPWHEALLYFVQRYKRDLTAEQVAVLKAVTRAKPHAVGEEVRRELNAAMPINLLAHSSSSASRLTPAAAAAAKRRADSHMGL